MAPKGVSGVGKRAGRDETPSRAPRSRPQRRHMAPPTPISPEASQLSEQGVPFSQPAGVVQAALHGASDDDNETDDEDLVEVVPPSGQRQKTPTSRNLQYAHRREPARLPSEENERTVVKFNACWRVHFTPRPGRPHKPLPGWKNSKSDTSQPLFRALNDWVKAVLAMQPSPMKQMDLAAVVYYQGQPKGERLIESMYDVVALQRHTRFAAAMELVQEVAYEHLESPVLVDFDLVLMPEPPVVHAPSPLPPSSNSTARQEAQLPARNAALLLTAASTVTDPLANIKVQLRKLREMGAKKRKRDGNSDASEQLTRQLTQVTQLMMVNMLANMSKNLGPEARNIPALLRGLNGGGNGRNEHDNAADRLFMPEE
ncbi:hypothetical protein CC86DRAFT_431445 [Ophiobolus disseminans]|uniref:Uncharacterized protein n=1 Tax=Ophiobolus disseminans TaxID=1469910 RepID=A0A6A7AEB4_9PLEO|nr:hypothetical protein CC86DRAFT_431445 [Ophiobolus disseminans]